MKKFEKLIKTKADWSEVNTIANKCVERAVDFVVIMKRPQRTLDQNAYLHVVIQTIYEFYLNEQGINCDIDGVKIELKETFGLWQLIHKPNGEVVRVLRSTVTYDMEEMRNFIERIVMFYEEKFGLSFKSEIKEFINAK